MTRENKLALVVGFGLILLVGVLVSDHFSTASSQQSAEFRSRADDPMRRLGPDPSFVTTSPAITAAPRTGQEPQTLEPSEPSGPSQHAAANVGAPGTTDGASPTIHRPRQSPVHPPVDAPIEMGAPINPRVPQGLSSEPAPQATDPNIRHHHVIAGESMTSIARQYYGTDEVVDALAAFNNIDDPNRLSINRRLRIPSLSVLRGGAPAEATASAPTGEPARAQAPAPARTPLPAPAPTRTYTVRNGDILSRIAAREMGSARHANAIFEANRHILRDKNDLRPGMVLTLPDVSS